MTLRPAPLARERPSLPEGFFGDAVALLTRLAGASSPSDEPVALRRMAEILSEELRARGLTVAIREEPDERGELLPVVEACSPAEAATPGQPILLIGHFDTVLDAAEPRLEGDRLYATGAVDMKGGIAAFLKALDLVALRGGRLPALRLVLVPDEEVGGAISRRAVAAAGSTARALWVLEPGERRGSGETLVTGRRGIFHWRLTVQGRSAHSGLAFWQGRSAVVAAAEWIRQAAGLSRPDGGPTVNVARIVAGERGLVEGLTDSGSRRAREVPTSVVFGSGHHLNVVADRALVEGEARFLRASEADLLESELALLAAAVASRCEVAIDFHRHTTVAPFDPAGLPATQADRAVALAAAAGWELAREDDRGGISFPNFLAAPGKIPVLDGLGPVGGGMHTQEEFIELDSLARRIHLLADLLQSESTPSADG